MITYDKASFTAFPETHKSGIVYYFDVGEQPRLIYFFLYVYIIYRRQQKTHPLHNYYYYYYYLKKARGNVRTIM